MTPLSLTQNLILSAGAGTGKTYSLMTLALHVLGGARAGREPLPAARLCVVTFTEKAAAQLRESLKARVEGLCREGTLQTEEPELRRSLEALGLPFPSLTFWRGVRDALPRAQVGTFHALALRWLRRLVAEGESPAAALLDEESARSLLEDCVERTVVARLDAGDAAIAQLCAELGFSGRGRAGGLIDEVENQLLRLREEGLAPDAIQVGDPGEAERAVEAHREMLKGAIRDALQGDLTPRARAALAALLDGLHGPLNLTQLCETARRGLTLSGPRRGGSEALKRVKHGILGDRESRTVGLADLVAQRAAAPLEAAFRDLVVEASGRYRAEQLRRGVMDFAELLERVRDAWRDSPSARRDAQSRVGALLVDEFQDTNRTQLDLVVLLAEQREAGPRQVAPGGAVDLPLEPGFLAIVGDRKQSIYEFRGADVSLFEVLARKMEAADGTRGFLQQSYRSTPELLELFNRGFARWMPERPEARDYEVGFGPHDVLHPVRATPQSPQLTVLLNGAPDEEPERTPELEARSVARLLAATLAERDAQGKPVLRGGDIAVLFRRFTHLETYRQALIAARVPHQVWRGRGFFAAPEVRDVEALLAFLCDPDDVTSLAALLRSPFVGLSDASLLALVDVAGGRVSRESLRRQLALPPEVTREEAQRWERFWKQEASWRADREVLDARSYLQRIIEESEYAVAAAAGPHGDQVLANLDKLVERAGRAVANGRDRVASFAVELRRLLKSETREAQAELRDGIDPDAVQLLTVHQSKGLEWPMVVVPDLAARPFRPPSKLIFERTLGLALRNVGWDAEGTSARFRKLNDELNRRADAEDSRLFYVALTRARDRLVLSGFDALPERRPAGGWLGCVAGLLDAELGNHSIRQDPPAALPPRLRAVVPSSIDEARVEALRRHAAQLRAAPPPPRLRTTLTLQQWVTLVDCARRFHLEQVRLETPPVAPNQAAFSDNPAPFLDRSRARATPLRTTVLDSRPEAQMIGEALSQPDEAAKMLRVFATVNAMSARGLESARRLVERAASAHLPDGWTTAIEVRSVRDGRIEVEHDERLAVLDAELAVGRMDEATAVPPARLAPATCRAFGCEFFPRCHPQGGTERV